ncbi:MvaI/BcnI family restriction endonuclease [Mucilaginibacter sp.]|uniref:MvaI/BcnI family restriction endonuclease n=1 Tax=Mucilaginibacter sp. TaxID=1882438 RepID=UPI0025D49393|nr:MvaI/BcnI family restriction endonuclease [Mucilaginibacter sp.]
MTLENLKRAFIDHGCNKIYIKTLSANDNSKNQVYLSGSYEILNIFPISEVKADSSGDWKKERFKASINFSWITEDGRISNAPNSQFILYPKYPEVRFSGFLKGSKDAPSDLMTKRLPGRLLLLAVAKNGRTIGYVSSPESEVTKEINSLNLSVDVGVFKILDLKPKVDYREILLNELLRIHSLGWIDSKRLHKTGAILPCESSNCGGYTLEAELGISANGYSEPDYLGYEIKQFKAANFDKISNEVITLMTPEPNGGIYVDKGVGNFIRTYGYEDKSGKEDRLNIGGKHLMGIKQPLTGLTLELIGFDVENSKIRNAGGSISLIDEKGNEASSWSFTSLIKHWNRKHNQACYVPSKSLKEPDRKYYYGNNVLIGNGTDFQLFLKQMALGNIYYDPGIKMEHASKTPLIKRRSQFRIKSGNLNYLYHKSETVNLLTL